jgi:hypothetical protein
MGTLLDSFLPFTWIHPPQAPHRTRYPFDLPFPSTHSSREVERLEEDPMKGRFRPSREAFILMALVVLFGNSEMISSKDLSDE